MKKLVGALILNKACIIFGKKGWNIILSLLQVPAFIAMYLFPVNNAIVQIMLCCIIGLGNSAAFIGPGMISDCIEYGAWKFGNREEGIAGSFLSLAAKIATAVAGSAAVLMLAGVGYVAGAEQTLEVKNGINMVVNIIPGILLIVSIIPLFFYKLTNKFVDQIHEEMRQNKE